MTIYSHSRLKTFEQCPFKFKLKYLDKIKSEMQSVEGHLGKTVHISLEWLYTQVNQNKIPTIDDLITHYMATWKERYNPEIVIVKQDMTTEHYFNEGVKFLTDYYTKHRPFNDNTLDVEKRIMIDLDENQEYRLLGFIDRLSYNQETKEYEIHDYKTGKSFFKNEDERQLALYSIGIKQIFGQDKKICLIWHQLAHNQKVCVRKTDDHLEQLKKQIIDLINQIESTTKFPPYISKLCDWCEYKKMCSAWKE